MSKYLLDTNIISSYLRGDETLKENFIFVTDNTKHFKRIKNLKIEN
jgi:predicted nucleic acid-binding protein